MRTFERPAGGFWEEEVHDRDDKGVKSRKY